MLPLVGLRRAEVPPLEEWAHARPYLSETERADCFADWLHTYIHHRGHTALKDKSPADLVPNLRGQNSYGPVHPVSREQVAARSPDDLVFPSQQGGYLATLTLDRYGHLFADELVDVAAPWTTRCGPRPIRRCSATKVRRPK